MSDCGAVGLHTHETQADQIVSDFGGPTLEVASKADEIVSPEFYTSLILHALPELAAFGLCHQDITVHNILLLSERKMVLIDFGLSRPFEQVFATSNRVLLGWEYMYYPPEYDFFSYLEGMSEKDVIHNRTETLFMIGLKNLMKQVLVFDTFIKECIDDLNKEWDSAKSLIAGIYGARPTTEMAQRYLESCLLRCAANKVDAYSLGTCILLAMDNCAKVIAADLRKDARLRNLMNLAVAMTDPIVFRRPCPAFCAGLWPGVLGGQLDFLKAIHEVQRTELELSARAIPELAARLRIIKTGAECGLPFQLH